MREASHLDTICGKDYQLNVIPEDHLYWKTLKLSENEAYLKFIG